MALQLRQTTNDPILLAVVEQLNQLRDGSVGANVHGAKSMQGSAALAVTAAAPTSLPTRIALVNQAKVVLNAHMGDASAHKTALSPVVATAVATDEPTAITLANALKAAYNTHRTLANAHFNDDVANIVEAANATNTATLDTLLAELKIELTAHIAAALPGQHIEFVAP